MWALTEDRAAENEFGEPDGMARVGSTFDSIGAFGLLSNDCR